ncbi:MAG: NAD(P)H-hydrate epimerase [Parcubacteria group bacterium QH_9_35_7]|nr:MAG: NAD(P)H-hydrate epimerase [Parcubacteria group bacterium QH_9_35_7]
MHRSTAEEMKKIDKLAVESGLEIKQMMELAGWHMISVFDQLDLHTGNKVTILAGKGNKGGDGLAAARHLINRGFQVSIVLANSELKEKPQQHLSLLNEMNTKVLLYSEAKQMAEKEVYNTDIIIDSLIGYNLKGSPRENFKEIIEITNSTDSEVISYDIPTGIDATTGHCFSPCIQADVTLTLALLKKGLQENEDKVGKLFLGDIGIPEFIYNKIKPGSKPDFKEKGIIEV